MSEPKPKSFEISKWAVWDAYRRVKANKGGAGVDGESMAEFERDLHGNLYKLWNRLSSGSYFPPPVRAVQIPKRDGSSRTLGVPTVADRIAQTVVPRYLEPDVEPVFHEDSYGYRPGRSALDAFGVCRERCWRQDWVLDLDIRCLLGAIVTLPTRLCGSVKEGIFGLWDQYTQAFSTSAAYVDGLKLAALYTLQYSLAADAEYSHRVEHRDVTGRSVLDEQCTQLVVDAKPPRGAGSVLFAADESVLQPAIECGCRDTELIGSFADRQQLTVGWLGGQLVAWNVAVTSQAADNDFGETLTCRRAPSLAVEDSSNPAVVIVTGEALDQRDRVVIGADRGLGVGSETASSVSAPPRQRSVTVARRCARLTSSITSSMRQRKSCLRSRSVVVGADHTRPRSEPSARSCSRSSGVSVRGRSRSRRASGLGLGLGQLTKRLLPVALEAARDQAVLGLDLAVAALGPLCLIARPLDLKPPLRKSRVVVGLEHLGRTQRGLHAGRRERCEQRADHGLLDSPAADAHAPAPAVLDQVAARAVIGGTLVTTPALVVDHELAPAAPADGDALQERLALAHGATGLVCARARVGGELCLVSLEHGLVDEARVVIPDQDLPLLA